MLLMSQYNAFNRPAPRATARSIKRALHLTTVASCALLLGACSTLDRLAEVGEAPALTAIKDPTTSPGYRPVSMPMPEPEAPVYNANSLWRTGSRAFFNDQRARQVGDILTVDVAITDSASIDNSTQRQRQSNDNVSVNSAAGLDQLLGRVLPGGVEASALVDTTTTGSASGSGSVDRSEEIVTKVAAVVTQVLPNGNLVIEGRQEVRVNFEVRELVVAGIVRPEDIGSDNAIKSSKIAEARIAYGGRGQISAVQQPRYGSQVLDIILPF
jgi:flagellar L-ring protein precursor FlgH